MQKFIQISNDCGRRNSIYGFINGYGAIYLLVIRVPIVSLFY